MHEHRDIVRNIELTAEQFAAFAGKHHDDVVAHYLGRDMKGTTCLAYIGERPDLFPLDLARVLVEPGLSGAIFHSDVFDTLRSQMDALGDPTTDVPGATSWWTTTRKPVQRNESVHRSQNCP